MTVKKHQLWCITANIKKQIAHGKGGLAIQNGSNFFKVGAKICITDCFFGMR